MYALIDRSHMRFFAKHEQVTPLSYLSHIELPHVHTYIGPMDSPADFSEFTILELKLLHKNTTGIQYHGSDPELLCAACFALAKQISLRALNTFELEIQARSIDANDMETRYRYVPGSTKPQQESELFEPAPLTCKQEWSLEDLVRVARNAKQPPQAAIVAAATLAPAAPAALAVPPKARPPAAQAAPRGAGRTLIWATMDEVWSAAGSPRDVKQVLTLRKVCMDKLESLGVKRTSASCELGNWMKARCS
jgi:hypothetical protein